MPAEFWYKALEDGTKSPSGSPKDCLIISTFAIQFILSFDPDCIAGFQVALSKFVIFKVGVVNAESLFVFNSVPPEAPTKK